MPRPQFRFFIKIIICQFEKELDVGIWECSLSRWNETNAGKCIEIREAKTCAVCSDNTGITLCNSLKVSPRPRRTEAQSGPWHGFNVPVLWGRKIDRQLVVCWSTFEHFYSAITNEFSLLMLWHFSGKRKTFTIRNRGGRRGRGSCQEENQRQEEGEREGVWGEEEEEAEARAFVLDSESESPVPQPAGGAAGGAGHACGPQRADLLPLQPGVLRRDDRVRQQRLSHRVVPLRLPGHHHQAQGEVVLSPVCSILQEEAMIENEFDVGAPRSTNIYSSEVFVECNKFDFILFLFWKLNK